MLQSPQPPQAETLITLLINDLARKQELLILALDDYHFIQNPLIHELVTFLLEHQPAQIHQVILTREDPLLPVSRLLSRGQASEVRQDDLRFTADETGVFFHRTMGIKLARDDIDALHRRTEGWVAGLQLAALSMQGQDDLHNFVKYFAGSNRYILDYLFEEVFTCQTADVQEFLVRTSVLNQLTAELCDEVAVRSDSQELLESLERTNLFIVPLDLSREWYRYHRLFRDLLRHSMQIRADVNETDLHLRASKWYMEHGLNSDAVHHALAASEWVLASDLILDLSDRMMKRGEIVTLLGWFTKFPDELMRADPELCLGYIWTLILTGQNEMAESLLAHVEENTNDQPQYHGSLTSAQAYLARTNGDIPGTIELSERALELIPKEDKSTRSILAVNLGIAYWHSGQMEEAAQALDEALRTAQEAENYYALLAALIFLGRVEAVRGNLQKAAEMIQLALKNGKSAPLTGLAHIDLGALQYEWNDLKTSRENVLKGLEIIDTSGNFEWQVAGLMLLARLESALTNTKSVNECLRKLQELEGSVEVLAPNRARSHALRAEIALQRGDLSGAQQLAEQIKMDVDAHSFYRFFGLIRERILIGEGRKKEATQSLTCKADQAERVGWIYGWIAAQILRALATENLETGIELLREALVRSHQEGFIRVYADHGQAIKPFLVEAAQRGVTPEYIGQILAAIQVPPEKDISPTGIVEQLSEREIEVLRLVSAGLTNREIAKKLYLSPGTIKTHVHNICGKLGVTNRTQAVMRARDLNLI